jgi:hypothetical protein
VNAGPLSDWKEVGIPNLGMMWVTMIDATVEALLLEVRKASNNRESVHQNQNVIVFFHFGYVSKIYLPICPLVW